MRSVRLDPELEAWLEDTARQSGRSVSEIIREAVQRFRREREGELMGPHLKRVAGAIDSGGASSRRTGRDFTELLKKKDEQRRKRAR